MFKLARDWKDPEQVRAYYREYHQKNRGRILAARRTPEAVELRRAWHAARRERDNALGRANYQRNREKRLAETKAYALAHPEQVKATQRRARLAHKARLAILKSGPCTDCGKTYPPYVMDFDHRDPATKAVGLQSLYACDVRRLLAEIAKCDLVCANCHRERTEQQRRRGELPQQRRKVG